MNKKQTTIISALSLVAIVLALLLSSRLWFRVDLTANKAYTISPVSRQLSRDIPDQMKITYFVSKRLQQLYPQPGEIIDLIREYVTYSHGAIKFTVRDPDMEGLADQMQALGIPARQIQNIVRNEATVSMVYSGILLEYLEKVDVIPVVFSTETLEYDLTSRIRALAKGYQKEAGIILGDSRKTMDQNFRGLTQFLTLSGYRIRQLEPGEEIPEKLRELIVIGGVDTLDEGALYRIDRYIQGGGKVFFAVENFAPVLDGSSIRAEYLRDRGLIAMLGSYGVEVQRALALDENSLTTTYQGISQGGAPTIRLIQYPFWINVTGEGSNRGHPITATFAGMDLFWPNPLELKEVEGVEGVPLLYTSKNAWLKTIDFTIAPDNAYMFERQKEETLGQKTLAAALSGKFPSYWRDRPKPVGNGGDEILPDMPEESGESRIVVIGNDEFINDEYLEDERNLAFVLQTADWLVSDDDVSGIRNRASGIGRLDSIKDRNERLAAMTFARTLNVIIIPVLVLIFAIFKAWKRRSETKNSAAGGSDAL